MLEQKAQTIKVDEHAVWVEVDSRSGCSGCSSTGCISQVVSKLSPAKKHRLQLPRHEHAKVGREVIVGIPDSLLVSAALWGYLVPLLFMLVGGGVGVVLGANEVIQSLLALLGLAVGFFTVHLVTRNRLQRRQFEVRPLESGLLGGEVSNLTRSRE